ncbi:MAG: glycosyltransferase family 2 protein [Blautia sp.]|nr:glycosyltransferase family 2 protein [Blautia sp.]
MVNNDIIREEEISSKGPQNKKPCYLYLVLPVYNEEELLEENIGILQNYYRVLMAAGEIREDSRILLVDDGSKDRSWEIISSFCSAGSVVEGLKLSRNEGQQTALYAGMKEACELGAEVVITLDVDLQQDIHAIPRFLAAYRQGADIVNGKRTSRETDSFFKRHSASVYYKCMKWLGCELLPDSADYRLMSARALEALMQYGESDLFIRGMVPTLGFRSAIVEFDVHERTAGSTKFTLGKMLSLAGAGITSFSTRPIRLVFLLGLLVLLTSGIMMIHILVDYLHNNAVSGWSSILASIWLLGGIAIFSIGIVGEYVGRAYMESKKRPRYFIEEKKIHKDKDDTDL